MHKLSSLTYPLLLALALPVTVPVAAQTTPLTADREHVPRTLREAGFFDRPILTPESTPQPVAQPAAQTPATPETPTPELRVLPRVGGSFTTGPGVGYDSSFGSIEGFVPLSQTPGQNLTFLQGRALVSTEDAQLGGNVVLGYRAYSRQSNRTWGGYVSYDVRDTGNSTFNQMGLGLESLGATIDFRANGYIAIGDTRQKIEESSFSTSTFTPQAPSFQGNFLAIGTLNQVTQVSRRFEAAMSGFDAEAGVKLARIGAGALRGYGGLYYYDAPGTAGTVGIRGRLEARPTDNFQVGLSVQHDDKFGTNVVLSVAANFPGTRPRGAQRQDEVVARLGEGVTRQENIVVDQQRETRPVSNVTSVAFATNPATNQPYLFQHVGLGIAGGNGTIETPFGTVQAALNATRSDGNDIVYVQAGSNPGIPAFTIPNNVQVLSTGPVQVLPTVGQGNVRLPLSGAGVLPTVLPAGSTVPSVTVSNNTTLSGFAINNATNVGIGNEGSTGTGANPISNVTIRDNQIVGSGTEGIRLTNVTSAINLFSNTVANSVAGDGIRIANTSGQANVTIGNNQITGNGRTGIAFLLNNTAQVSSTISGNTISNNTVDGIFVSRLGGALTDSAQLNNVRFSENTISGNGGNGINFRLGGNSSASNVTFAENQISSNNGAGIVVDLVDNTQATVTIAGNTILGNISSGIFLAARGSSNLFSTVSNNTLTNNNTNPGVGGDAGNFVAQSIGTGNSRVCLNLANNTSINPNPAGADYNFFIDNNTPAQFLFSASGNSPTTINFLLFAPPAFPPANPALFAPLGNCAVP